MSSTAAAGRMKDARKQSAGPAPSRLWIGRRPSCTFCSSFFLGGRREIILILFCPWCRELRSVNRDVHLSLLRPVPLEALNVVRKRPDHQLHQIWTASAQRLHQSLPCDRLLAIKHLAHNPAPLRHTFAERPRRHPTKARQGDRCQPRGFPCRVPVPEIRSNALGDGDLQNGFDCGNILAKMDIVLMRHARNPFLNVVSA